MTPLHAWMHLEPGELSPPSLSYSGIVFFAFPSAFFSFSLSRFPSRDGVYEPSFFLFFSCFASRSCFIDNTPRLGYLIFQARLVSRFSRLCTWYSLGLDKNHDNP